MKKHTSHDALQEHVERRAQRRDKKRQTKMAITGKGVFTLQRVIQKKK